MAGMYEDRDIPSKTPSQYVMPDVEDNVQATQNLPSFRPRSNDGNIVSQHENQNLVRGLAQRHIQMIAIAGAIVSDRHPHPITLV